jgi:hypothetical protein
VKNHISIRHILILLLGMYCNIAHAKLDYDDWRLSPSDFNHWQAARNALRLHEDAPIDEVVDTFYKATPEERRDRAEKIAIEDCWRLLRINGDEIIKWAAPEIIRPTTNEVLERLLSHKDPPKDLSFIKDLVSGRNALEQMRSLFWEGYRSLVNEVETYPGFGRLTPKTAENSDDLSVKKPSKGNTSLDLHSVPEAIRPFFESWLNSDLFNEILKSKGLTREQVEYCAIHRRTTDDVEYDRYFLYLMYKDRGRFRNVPVQLRVSDQTHTDWKERATFATKTIPNHPMIYPVIGVAFYDEWHLVVLAEDLPEHSISHALKSGEQEMFFRQYLEAIKQEPRLGFFIPRKDEVRTFDTDRSAYKILTTQKILPKDGEAPVLAEVLLELQQEFMREKKAEVVDLLETKYPEFLRHYTLGLMSDSREHFFSWKPDVQKKATLLLETSLISEDGKLRASAEYVLNRWGERAARGIHRHDVTMFIEERVRDPKLNAEIRKIFVRFVRALPGPPISTLEFESENRKLEELGRHLRMNRRGPNVQMVFGESGGRVSVDRLSNELYRVINPAKPAITPREQAIARFAEARMARNNPAMFMKISDRLDRSPSEIAEDIRKANRNNRAALDELAFLNLVQTEIAEAEIAVDRRRVSETDLSILKQNQSDLSELLKNAPSFKPKQKVYRDGKDLAWQLPVTQKEIDGKLSNLRAKLNGYRSKDRRYKNVWVAIEKKKEPPDDSKIESFDHTRIWQSKRGRVVLLPPLVAGVTPRDEILARFAEAQAELLDVDRSYRIGPLLELYPAEFTNHLRGANLANAEILKDYWFAAQIKMSAEEARISEAPKDVSNRFLNEWKDIEDQLSRRFAAESDSDILDRIGDAEAQSVASRQGEILSEEDRRRETQALERMNREQRDAYRKLRTERVAVKDAIRAVLKR